MAIKFEKIQPGMRLYDRHRERMGNTNMRTLGEWPVKVIEVDAERRRALVSWNGNKPTWCYAAWLSKLSDWSMHDKSVAVIDRSVTFGQVYRCRKLTKAEREARAKP